MSKLEKQFEALKCKNGSAVLSVSNFGGIEMVFNYINGGVLYKWYGNICRRWQKLKTSSSGREYITIYGIRYYIDDFMALQ